MTQRDIAKDKERVTPYYFLLGEDHPLVEITIHYINAVEALEARISELESLVKVRTVFDARKPQTHAQMMSDALDKLTEHKRNGII